MFIFFELLYFVDINTIHKKISDLARFLIKTFKTFNTFQKHPIESIFEIFNI